MKNQTEKTLKLDCSWTAPQCKSSQILRLAKSLYCICLRRQAVGCGPSNWVGRWVIFNLIWSSPEKGENFTNSASSTPEFMFEFTDPSLRGEVNSNMNSGVLELKLHKVHFADKFSSASQARLRRTCLLSAPCAVSTQVHLSSCLSTPLLASSDRCTQTWTQVYLKLSRWSSLTFQDNFI